MKNNLLRAAGWAGALGLAWCGSARAQSPPLSASVTGLNQCVFVQGQSSQYLQLNVTGVFAGTLVPYVQTTRGGMRMRWTVTAMGGSMAQLEIDGPGGYWTGLTLPTLFSLCFQYWTAGAATIQVTVLASPPAPPGGAVASVFGRTGTVAAASGDYNVTQVTGAAPSSSPWFAGVVTLPGGTDNGTTFNYVGSGGIAAANGTFSSNLTVNGQLLVAGPWLVNTPVAGAAMAAAGAGTSSFGISSDGNFYISANAGTPARILTAPVVATITASGAPNIAVAASAFQTITLNANATATASEITAAASLTLEICQPASGGPYTWAWPASFSGGMTIGTTASKCSVQKFVSFTGTSMVAEAAGVANVGP